MVGDEVRGRESGTGSSEKAINLPLTPEAALALKAGDLVKINGKIVTGRDRIHKFMAEDKPDSRDIPFALCGSILYHCGPIIKKLGNEYKVIAAGPTTSMRVEMFEASVLRRYGFKGIMGKGGMGEKTRQALKENGCVYLHTTGGAAAYLADRITQVMDVWKLDEFGPTEAMWLFEVRDFPAIVTMDAHGNDLHKDIEGLSLKKFREIAGK